MIPAPDPAGTEPDAPGDLSLERLPQFRQPIVRRADDWVLFGEELLAKLSGAAWAGTAPQVLQFGSPAHELGEVTYRYYRPGEKSGTHLYRRVS